MYMNIIYPPICYAFSKLSLKSNQLISQIEKNSACTEYKRPLKINITNTPDLKIKNVLHFEVPH